MKPLTCRAGPICLTRRHQRWPDAGKVRWDARVGCPGGMLFPLWVQELLDPPWFWPEVHLQTRHIPNTTCWPEEVWWEGPISKMDGLRGWFIPAKADYRILWSGLSYLYVKAVILLLQVVVMFEWPDLCRFGLPCPLKRSLITTPVYKSRRPSCWEQLRGWGSAEVLSQFPDPGLAFLSPHL